VAILVELLGRAGFHPHGKRVATAEGITLRDGLYWGEAPTGRCSFRERNSVRRPIWPKGRRPDSIWTSATIAARPRVFSRPQSARHVLLQRRVLAQRRRTRPRARGAGHRLQPESRRTSPGECRVERRTTARSRRPIASRRCKRWLRPQALWRRDPRSSQVRPEPAIGRRSPAGLSSVESSGGRRDGPGESWSRTVARGTSRATTCCTCFWASRTDGPADPGLETRGAAPDHPLGVSAWRPNISSVSSAGSCRSLTESTRFWPCATGSPVLCLANPCGPAIERKLILARLAYATARGPSRRPRAAGQCSRTCMAQNGTGKAVAPSAHLTLAAAAA